MKQLHLFLCSERDIQFTAIAKNWIHSFLAESFTLLFENFKILCTGIFGLPEFVFWPCPTWSESIQSRRDLAFLTLKMKKHLMRTLLYLLDKNAFILTNFFFFLCLTDEMARFSTYDDSCQVIDFSRKQ